MISWPFSYFQPILFCIFCKDFIISARYPTADYWGYRDSKTLMRTLCKRAGVAYFRFHALRHFGSSVLDRANISLGSIRRILGHENRTTTEIYLHSIDEIDRAAMAYFGAQIEKKSHTDSHTEKIKGLR